MIGRSITALLICLVALGGKASAADASPNPYLTIKPLPSILIARGKPITFQVTNLTDSLLGIEATVQYQKNGTWHDAMYSIRDLGNKELFGTIVPPKKTIRIQWRYYEQKFFELDADAELRFLVTADNNRGGPPLAVVPSTTFHLKAETVGAK